MDASANQTPQTKLSIPADCPCCKDSAASFTLRYQDLWECSTCQSLQWAGRHFLASDKLYGHDYFHSGEYLDYTAHKNVHERNARFKWKVLKPFLRRDPSILEIGCAYGFFVNFLRQQGIKDAFGYDVSPDAIQNAVKNFGPYFTGDKALIPKKKYDLLTLWDTWEHLPDPDAALTEFYSGLHKGSFVALTTVDAGSLVAKIRRSHWRQIHPPTHTVYPTRKGIKLHLEKHGFKIVLQKSYSPYRALEVYLNALGLRRLCPAQLRGLPVKLNLHDLQIVLAEKI
jgi:SAM-dependent methyltransferase